MARASDQKAVVDSIVDEELAAQKLIAEIGPHSTELGKKVAAMAKRLLASRNKNQLAHHPEQSKELLRQAFMVVFIRAYLEYMRPVQSIVDTAIKEQDAAIKKYGKPVTTIDAVRDEDVKQRAAEKAGL